MKWFYAKGGSQKGPVDTEEMRAKIASGEVEQSDLVWREGMRDWVAASEVAELWAYGQVPSAAGPPPTPAADAGESSAPVAVSPYHPPAAAPQTTRPASYGPAEVVPNYLWQSIAVTVLCCVPFGIAAIIYAAKVDGLVARGQIAEARQASNNAKIWAWVSFGCGLAVVLLYGLLMVVGIAADA